MLKDEILALLKSASAPLSGQAMSEALGVSRAAVWKAVEALRGAGYAVASAPGRGYALEHAPDVLSPGELAGDRAVVGRALVCLDSVDSTNEELRRRAAAAPDGLCVVSTRQTSGRGRRGRPFQSLPGGLYLSVLLRPRDLPLDTVTQLTAWTAVAVCRAIEAVTGLAPGVKWTNDIILDARKVCGIGTELSLEAESGFLDYVVVGIGVNVGQTEDEFGPELSRTAVSLGQLLEKPPRRAALASALLDELDELYAGFPAKKAEYLAAYRSRCVTVGHEVRLIRPGKEEVATAEAVDDDFALVVRHGDGRVETVNAGEVSVRGLLGYV